MARADDTRMKALAHISHRRLKLSMRLSPLCADRVNRRDQAPRRGRKITRPSLALKARSMKAAVTAGGSCRSPLPNLGRSSRKAPCGPFGWKPTAPTSCGHSRCLPGRGFPREVQPRRQHWFLNEKSGFPFRTPAFCSVSRGQRRLGEKEYRAPSVTPGVALRPRTQGLSRPTTNTASFVGFWSSLALLSSPARGQVGGPTKAAHSPAPPSLARR